MSVVISSSVSIKVTGLLKSKQLPGTWAVLYDASNKEDKCPRLELYKSQKSASPMHTLCLENLKFPDKSFQLQEPFFVLSIKKEKYHFQFDSLSNKEDWVHSLCHVSTQLWQQRRSAFNISDDHDSSEMMNENLLYDSSGSVQQFKVSIIPTKASEVNDLHGSYVLCPTKDALQLLDVQCSRCLHEWPYKQIRKYGRTRLVFKLEVGRSCSTGAGEFEFVAPESMALINFISLYMEHVRQEGLRQSGDGKTRADGALRVVVGREQGSMDNLTPSPQSLTPSPRMSPVPLSSSSRSNSPTQHHSHQGMGATKRDSPLPVPRHEASGLPREQVVSGLSQQEKAARGKETEGKKASRGLCKQQGRPGPANASSHERIYDEPDFRDQVFKDPTTGALAQHQSSNVQVNTNSRSSHSEVRPPPLPPYYNYADEEDMYNHLGDLKLQKAATSVAEPVYGMASATITISNRRRPPPPPGSNAYEDTSCDSSIPQPAGDIYESV